MKGDKESLIVEHRINKRTSITYFYPYLYRTGIIFFPDDIFHIRNLATKCDDNNCRYCDPYNPYACKKCWTGFCLKNECCVEKCGKDFVVYILRGKCQANVVEDNK